MAVFIDKKKSDLSIKGKVLTFHFIDKKKSNLLINRGVFIDKKAPFKITDSEKTSQTKNKHKRDDDKLLTKLVYQLQEKNQQKKA